MEPECEAGCLTDVEKSTQELILRVEEIVKSLYMRLAGLMGII